MGVMNLSARVGGWVGGRAFGAPSPKSSYFKPLVKFIAADAFASDPEADPWFGLSTLEILRKAFCMGRRGEHAFAPYLTGIL